MKVKNIYCFNEELEDKKLTINGIKKGDVTKELINSIQECEIEKSIACSVELMKSNNTIQLIDRLFTYYLEEVNVNNYKLLFYLYEKMEKIKMMKCKYGIQNNQYVRNFVAEMITLIINSKYNYDIYQKFKITVNDFQGDNLLLITRDYMTKQFLLNKDFKTVSINEFEYQIKKNKYKPACYWLDWYIFFLKDQKLSIENYKIYFKEIFEKLIMLSHSNNYIIRSRDIFMDLFKKSQINKLKFIIYMCVYLIINPQIVKSRMNNNITQWLKVNLNINIMFGINENNINISDESDEDNNENDTEYKLSKLYELDIKKKQLSVKNYFDNIDIYVNDNNNEDEEYKTINFTNFSKNRKLKKEINEE